MNNSAESWHSGYIGQDIDYRSLLPPRPPPLHPAGHPIQGADRSFLGKENSHGELGENAFEMEQRLRHQLRKQFMKTQFCRYHLSGGCRKGATCEFAHDPNELARPPDLRRTSICKDWLEGKCLATDETCKFAHGNAMLRRTLGDDTAAGYRPAVSSSAAGPRMRSGAAKLFTTWEQQLLKQQVEQEQMKETIMAQQKTIDALMSLRSSGTATPGQHPVLPQMTKNKMQSGNEYPQQMQNALPQYPMSMPMTDSQGFPPDATQYRQQMQNTVPEHLERMLPSNSQGFPADAIDAVQMRNVMSQYPQCMIPANSQAFPSDAINAELRASPGFRL